MVQRLTRFACAAAIFVAITSLLTVVRAGGPYVVDLAQSAADVRWRHSGHQGPGAAAEYFGREMVTGDFNADGRTDLAVTAELFPRCFIDPDRGLALAKKRLRRTITKSFRRSIA